MAEEIEDVKDDEAPIEDVQPQEEPTEEPVEGVTPPVEGKDYKAIAEQLSSDIKEKNRKIQELKSQQPQPQVVEEMPQDEAVKRFIETEERSKKAEANSEILLKLSTDPSFVNRVEIVKDYVAQGFSIVDADMRAKADILDGITKEFAKEVKTEPIKQLNPQAIPEEESFKPTGDAVKDMLDDPNINPQMKEAVKRTFG